MSRPCTRLLRAFTKVELLVVLVVIGVLVVMTIPAMAKSRDRRNRIACVNNLRIIGLAFRIFSRTSAPEFPWTVDSSDGGSKEHVTNPAALWRHFAAISNEISHPKPFICPSDRERRAARSWLEFTNNHFHSYTVGISASENLPMSILASDRNLVVDGLAVSNTVLTLTTNLNAAWDRRIHRDAGNIMLGDGSVQQVTPGRLAEQFRDAAALIAEPQKMVVP